MTEWTDAEISRRLALAIGWEAENIWTGWLETVGDGVMVRFDLPSNAGYMWRKFDYRDPAVIWPIAERFDAFPWKTIDSDWCARVIESASTKYAMENADTAAKAVALAVIKSKEQA